MQCLFDGVVGSFTTESNWTTLPVNMFGACSNTYGSKSDPIFYTFLFIAYHGQAELFAPFGGTPLTTAIIF
jgi:hypothetical protein